MEWIEITAKTIAEAEEAALDELGIDRDEVEFVIVEEPKVGLFRQVRGTARLRARVAPRTPRAKSDRRNRRPRNDERADSRSEKPARPAKSRTTQKADRQAPGRSAPKSAKPQPTREEGTTMTMTLDEQVAAAEKFLQGLLEAGGFAGALTSERTDEANAHLNIVGDDLGLLIGPRGQTMNALQDLTRIVLQKQAAGSWEGHVHVDVNGYRAKRRDALIKFATTVADEVRTSGTPKALEPMSSADRKAVHDAINAIDGVHTSSEGHEPRRWVKIIPGDA